MSSLFRETVVGQLVRWTTGGRLLPWTDQLQSKEDIRHRLDDQLQRRKLKRQEKEEDKKSHIEQQWRQRQHQAPAKTNGDESSVRDAPPSDEPSDVEHGDGRSPPSSSNKADASGDSHQSERVKSKEHRAQEQQEQVTKWEDDPNLVDWDGPDDPDNPLNWPQWKKLLTTFLLCLMTFAIYIGSAIITPGIPDIAYDYGVSEVAATLSLTMFVIGYGIGPMLWSPMSEIPQIGRNPVYIGTLAMFVALQVPTLYANSLGSLLPLRFLAGFFGSPVLATGGASLADYYRPIPRTYAMSLYGAFAVCGPVFGPLLGGFAVQGETWQWSIWVLLWLSGGTLALLLFTLPETSSVNILYRKARRLRSKLGNDKLVSLGEKEGEQMTAAEIASMVLVRPFVIMLLDPIVLFLNLYIALLYGVLYIWFESFPLVFQGQYMFNLGEVGLAFLGILLGALVAMAGFFLHIHFQLRQSFEGEDQHLEPVELRLQPAMVGSFALPLCLFVFGWTGRESVPWIVPIIGSAFFGVGAFLLFQSILNYLADAYPKHAASVLAGNDFMRSMVGAAFPLFATGMYNNLGIGWASSLLAFLSVGMIPIPFVLYVYGGYLRQYSSYAG